MTFDHETYLSPLTWRYGSQPMREVWSEVGKRRLLRRVWVALAEAQAEAGLVDAEQVADLRAHKDEVDIERAAAIEAEIRHDLMAEIRTFAEQAPVGGPIIHLGATSMDILDNVDALRLGQAVDLILSRLEELLAVLAGRIEEEAERTAIALTHLQPAEPTTVGYRLAFYAQDLLADLHDLRRLRSEIRGKGLKGAVGTSASYTQLLEDRGWDARRLESRVMDKLGLEAFQVTHQTYPRRQDWALLNGLAGIAMTLHKFAFDLRLLQSPPLGEWSEPFGSKQVGSSAMPFKRNPINAENINSLARHLAALPRIAWDNGALSLLERTLDDSANRRLFLPEAFLLCDEILVRATRLCEGMTIWSGPTERNLADYGVFAASERLLMEAVKAGGDRQELHEVIRERSLEAWAAIQRGEAPELADRLIEDPRLNSLLSRKRIQGLLDASSYVGDAPERARAVAAAVRTAVAAAAAPVPAR